MKRLLISFSGGETSAYMALLIHSRLADQYSEIATVFANTGEEREETLEFVSRCDRAFGWNVAWVEADVQPDSGDGTKSKVVDYEAASRGGEPFEAVIQKYGIPGPGFLHCTRELKENPIRDYVRRVLGWPAGSYATAIGIRADEIDRRNVNAERMGFVYPLIRPFPTRKWDVNEFWSRQPFRLSLKGYQGNCKWCWKKSLRKHLTIMSETPEAFDFPERMERLYPMAGANPRNEEKRFFRDRMTVADIRRLAAEPGWEPAVDDAQNYQTDLFAGLLLDVGGGCSDGCEIGEAA